MSQQPTQNLKHSKASTITGIIFSKDRALQLDAGLRSFFRHCQDHDTISIKIIYTCSSNFFADQYQELSREHQKCDFVKEEDFKTDLIAAIKGAEHTLFLVDDNIFTQNFTIQETTQQLINNSEVLAFSLRLGRNTKECYILNTRQPLPDFTTNAPGNILHFNWTSAEGDFGFPLDVSSSIYRVSDLMPLVQRLDFHDPNTLELYLSHHKNIYEKIAPKLACFNNSVTFCNPVNIVNTSCICRAGERQEYSSLEFAKLFAQGLRIDIEKFTQFIPGGCHQEAELSFFKPQATASSLQQSTEKILNSSEDDFEKALHLTQTFIKMGLKNDADNVFSTYLKTHPEDRELVEAVTWWQIKEHNNETSRPRISVIIPAHNCAATISDSLTSVSRAFTFCESIVGPIEPEIVVVDDNSSDNTKQVLQISQQNCP
ncbi:MAG: glycosyltransferase, partial [Pseudomonadota bacterium]|nr:glycosyltransferase [Pseudomonadota bacterium]